MQNGSASPFSSVPGSPIFSLRFRRYEYFCSLLLPFFSAVRYLANVLFSFCFLLSFIRLSVLLHVFPTLFSFPLFLPVFISQFLLHRLFIFLPFFLSLPSFWSFLLPFHSSENLFHASLSSLQQLLRSLV